MFPALEYCTRNWDRAGLMEYLESAIDQIGIPLDRCTVQEKEDLMMHFLMLKWRDAGRDRGEQIAKWIEVPKMGDSALDHLDYIDAASVDFDTIETIDQQVEVMRSLACDAEEHDRQFTPFEFTARELNDLPEELRDDAWSEFDDGIAEGIDKVLAFRKANHLGR